MADQTQRKSPAFSCYAKDLLGDSKVAMMSNEEFGAYWRLCCYSWEDGSIPSDLDDLARMLPRTTKKKLAAMWRIIGKCFSAHPTMSDRLVQPRLEIERQKQQCHRKIQAQNGQKGGRPRKPEPLILETQTKPNDNPSLSIGLSESKAKKSLSSSSSSSSSSNNYGGKPPANCDSPRSLVLELDEPVRLQAYLILDAAWPVISAQHEIAIKRADWRNHNKRAAESLAKAGKTPEQVGAMLALAYSHPVGSKYYGGITTLAKLIEHWPKLSALEVKRGSPDAWANAQVI
jgi:uncharacterized protein YdaU (DUF1376 family)